jgi:ABC-type uncharacterized transport system involved in gliding motility auxiliary subunit
VEGVMAQQASKRRAANLATGVLYSIIVIGLLGGLNFLANRYNKSYDATANKKFTLSDQTDKIAKNLKQDVTITYWGQPSGFTEAKDLLDRYQNLSPKITVRYEDVEKNRTQALAAGVKNPIPNIFVQVGNKKGEAKGLTEEDITGAIVGVLKGGDRTVCFTIGSGEHSLDDTSKDGYSTAKTQTEKSNYKTKEIKLLPDPAIPADCTIVVVAGPKHDYLAPEVASLKMYVENGGRVLFLLDPPFKFAADEVDDNDALMNVLSEWGVTPVKNLVLDFSGVGQLYNAGPDLPIVTSYDNQAIVRDMKDVWTAFPLARSLDVKNGDKTKVDKLFETTDDSIATKNLSAPEIRPSKDDAKGPFTLGAAGTYTTGKENGNGRFVVVGSSGFPSNYVFSFNGNRDLFLNMLSWLSSDEDLISIRPKEPTDNPLNMNARQVSLMFYSSVFGLPLLIIAFGAGVWWKRR